VDKNEESVERARAKGVDAHVSDFLEFNPSAAPFDVILFARSLHHISPLGDAIAHAHKLLSPSGILIIDDFATEAVDVQTAIWFFGLKSVLAAGRELHSRGPKLEDGAIPADPLAAWRGHHFGHHGVTPSTDYLSAIRGRFSISSERRIPYLSRYFADDLTQGECDALVEWESRLCHWGAIRPIGVQVIARPL
jgi:SAM-dependent methyltransferase